MISNELLSLTCNQPIQVRINDKQYPAKFKTSFIDPEDGVLYAVVNIDDKNIYTVLPEEKVYYAIERRVGERRKKVI